MNRRELYVNNALETLQSIFEALGQEIRLRLFLILTTRSFCVCELEELFHVSQPAISRHLNILKEAGLVSDTRKGQWVFYRANTLELKALLTRFIASWGEPLAAFSEMEAFNEKLRFLQENPKVPCSLQQEELNTSSERGELK